MSDDLIFEEPPPRRYGSEGGDSPLALWLASLREHPGQWAKYPEPVANANTTQIRKGRRSGVEAGEFEVRSVTLHRADRHVTLYARYVGGAA